jgi:hypothetical protein
MKNEKVSKAMRSWLDPNKSRPFNKREEFRDKMVSLLEKDILTDLGPVHKSKLMKVGRALETIPQVIAALEDQLELGRSSEQALRRSHQKYGRARRKVQDSLDSLLLAQDLLQDQMGSELKQGWLKFSRPLQDLKRLEKRLDVLESTGAALIHPQLRKKTTERELAKKTSYTLHHPELRITKKSADLKSLAVELVDEQLQKLTDGKPDHANRFISKFFRISLGWNVKPSYVKTLRKRVRDNKILESINPHLEQHTNLSSLIDR